MGMIDTFPEGRLSHIALICTLFTKFGTLA